MRALMMVLLMVVSGFSAEDSAKATMLRISGGAGVGAFGLLAEGRMLGGVEGSPWRFGVQAMGMSEVLLFVTPNENVTTICFVAGREMLPTGAMSITLFGGGGLAMSELRGKMISSEWFHDTYESRRFTDPVLLAGADLSVSYRRIVGTSLQLGLHASRITTPYAAFQIDVGGW